MRGGGNWLPFLLIIVAPVLLIWAGKKIYEFIRERRAHRNMPFHRPQMPGDTDYSEN